MDDFWNWLGDDGIRLFGDNVIPVAAILVPTIIAVRLARHERLASEKADLRSRRLQAGADVLSALAALVSIDPQRTDMHRDLAALRGAIAIYRSWNSEQDLTGDWLALKHQQGMRTWSEAMKAINAPGTIKTPEVVAHMLEPARLWASETIDTFSGWLSGYIDVEVLRAEGARLLLQDGQPKS